MASNGAKLNMYMGHGAVNGWSTSSMSSIMDSFIIDNLDNTNKCPIGINTACNTGWFDHPTLKCMTEELTTYSPTNGFTGMYGIGRAHFPNYGDYNPPPFIPKSLQLFIPFSIWYQHSYIIGETILKSKISYISRFEGNYFGDPALNIMAHGMEVTHNIILSGNITISDEVTITKEAVVTLDNDCNVHFEGKGKFIVDEGSTIVIGENVTLTRQYESNNIAISGELVVNGNCSTDVNFLVNSGGKLTVNNKTMQLGSNTDIVIKPGAVMETNGGKLTSKLGGATWSGITVMGNPLLPQSPISNQGYLYLGQGTTIEHAMVGVNLSNGNNTGGGVVHVNGATFTDNVTAIRFDRYRSGSLPNLSAIDNSTFTTTSYLAQHGLTPFAFINLQGVSGD